MRGQRQRGGTKGLSERQRAGAKGLRPEALSSRQAGAGGQRGPRSTALVTCSWTGGSLGLEEEEDEEEEDEEEEEEAGRLPRRRS